MIRFSCPRCRSVVECADQQAGSQFICPRCGHSFDIMLPESVERLSRELITVS